MSKSNSQDDLELHMEQRTRERAVIEAAKSCVSALAVDWMAAWFNLVDKVVALWEVEDD